MRKVPFMVKQARKMQIKMNAKAFKKKNLYYNVEEIKDLNYMGDGDVNHNLDIYAPNGKMNELLPVIVEIHGGAYISCEKMINEWHGKYFASRGYKVVNINYTLQPEATFIEEMREMFAAIKWVEENAEKYAFDKNKIFLTGDSAGGHHVLLIAAIQNSEKLQKYYNIEPIKSGIKGIAATCPCADMRKIVRGEGGINKWLGKTIFQGGLDKDEEYIKNTTVPDIFDNSDYPDVFILTTPTDPILYNDTLAIHEMLNERKITHEYKEYVGTENKLSHVFNVGNPDYVESVKANDDILEYFKNSVE